MARLTPEERKFYGATKAAALVVEKSFASSCVRAGIAEAQFLATIRAHRAQSHTDPTMSAGNSSSLPFSHPTLCVDYLTATMVIADVGTARGNNLAYMKDLRYPNKMTLTDQQLALLQGQKENNKMNSSIMSTPTLVSRLQCASIRSAIAAHPCGRDMVYGRKKRSLFMGEHMFLGGSKNKEEELMLEVEVESMDAVGVHSKMGVDDCEGSAQVSTDLLRYLPYLAQQVTAAEAPLLHAACQVAATRIVLECVSSVSAAFVDTSGVELSRDAQRAMKDLPMIGDEQVLLLLLSHRKKTR